MHACIHVWYFRQQCQNVIVLFWLLTQNVSDNSEPKQCPSGVWADSLYFGLSLSAHVSVTKFNWQIYQWTTSNTIFDLGTSKLIIKKRDFPFQIRSRKKVKISSNPAKVLNDSQDSISYNIYPQSAETLKEGNTIMTIFDFGNDKLVVLSGSIEMKFDSPYLKVRSAIRRAV